MTAGHCSFLAVRVWRILEMRVREIKDVTQTQQTTHRKEKVHCRTSLFRTAASSFSAVNHDGDHADVLSRPFTR